MKERLTKREKNGLAYLRMVTLWITTNATGVR